MANAGVRAAMVAVAQAVAVAPAVLAVGVAVAPAVLVVLAAPVVRGAAFQGWAAAQPAVSPRKT